MPVAWRILYQVDGAWKPVATHQPYEIEKDRFNIMHFEPVTTAALRLEIEVQPVARYVRLEHVRVDTADLAKVITDVCDLDRDPPDFVDCTVFSRDHQYLTLGRFTDDPGRAGASDYTGQQIEAALLSNEIE